MRVDLLLCRQSQLSFESYAAHLIKPALEKLGVEVRSMSRDHRAWADYIAQEVWDADAFLSFSIQAPKLSLLTKKPQLFWEMRISAYHLHLAKEAYHWVGTLEKLPDEMIKELFQVLFLPASYGKQEKLDEKNRPFDLVFLDDLIAIDDLKRVWEKIFTKEESSEIEMIALRSRGKLTELIDAWICRSKASFNDLWFASEVYIATQRLIAILSTLVQKLNGVKIDIFGDHQGRNWLCILDYPQLTLHQKLPYTETLALLQQTKILVRTTPTTSEGSDAWILEALSRGAMVLTPKTPYLEKLFGPDAPLFYPIENAQALFERAMHFLCDERSRRLAIETLRAAIDGESYESRAVTIRDFFGDRHHVR